MRQRVYEVLVDDNVIVANNSTGRQIYVQFEVTVDALGAITFCDLTLSNLRAETINRAFKRGSILTLKAGYTDNSDVIFKGVIRNIFKGRDGATTSRQILARGGNLEKGVLNISLGQNAKLADILTNIGTAMGLNLVFEKSNYQDVYTRGYSATADPRTVLNNLSKAWKFKWAIENDNLIIFRQSEPRRAPIKTINMQSGLEGIPEVTEMGVDFSIRLDPSIRIGRLISLDTEYKTFNFAGVYYPNPAQEISGSGNYTIAKIIFSGNNYGTEWSTKITGYYENAQEIN